MKELLSINQIVPSVILLVVSVYIMYLGRDIKRDNKRPMERNKYPKAKKQKPIILMPEDIRTNTPPIILEEWEYRISENQSPSPSSSIRGNR